MQSTTVVVGGKGTNKKTTLYVGGLEESVNEAILHSAFIPFGEIKDVNIPLEHTTSKHRGFGFVEYEDPADAADAVDNMHNAELYSRVLRVNYAQPMKIKGGDKGWSHQPVWADVDEYLEQATAEKELEALADEQRLKEAAAHSARHAVTERGPAPQGDPPGKGAAAPERDPMAEAEAALEDLHQQVQG